MQGVHVLDVYGGTRSNLSMARFDVYGVHVPDVYGVMATPVKRDSLHCIETDQGEFEVPQGAPTRFQAVFARVSFASSESSSTYFCREVFQAPHE